MLLSQTALSERGYFASQQLVDSLNVALATRPVAGAFLFGPAGCGKSELPQVAGKILDREVVFAQCFPGTREDDLLVKLIPHEESPSGIKAVDGPVLEAAHKSRRKPTILVLDEWDKTRPSADSFLLDFLQSGRIRFNGRSTTARLDRLAVFLTSNDEREVSEPLLRRLPKIDFQPLLSPLVGQALSLTHPEHPQLTAAVVLYERCLMAELPKPATIQELRQLLDAITLLGDRADWDALVYQCVTKTRENHALLKRVESYEARSQVEERERLSAEAYEMREEQQQSETEPSAPALPQPPRLAEVRGFDPSFPAPQEIDYAAACGIVAKNDDTYNAVVALATAPTDDPAIIGDVAEVRGESIVFRAPIDLLDFEQVSNLWKQAGEILFTSSLPTSEDVRLLQQRGLKIVKYSRSEILAKAQGIDLRWTPEGTEIVVSLAARDSFKSVFGAEYASGTLTPQAWLEAYFPPATHVEDMGKNPARYGRIWLHKYATEIAAYQAQQTVKPMPQPVAAPAEPFTRWGATEIPLPCTDLHAVVVVEKVGQQDMSSGDDVRVQASIYLPTRDKLLHPDLRFGYRISVAGQNPTSTWGSYAPDSSDYSRNVPARAQHKVTNAATWNAAAGLAWNWATTEVAKLQTALEKRVHALEEA